MKKRKGFSLMEILVASAVVLVTMAFGFRYVSNYNSRQEVLGVHGEIATAVKLARNYAQTRQRPTGYSQEPDFVTINIGNTGWMIYADDEPDAKYGTKSWGTKAVAINGSRIMRFSPIKGLLVDGSGQNVGVGGSIMTTVGEGVGTSVVLVVNPDGVISEKK